MENNKTTIQENLGSIDALCEIWKCDEDVIVINNSLYLANLMYHKVQPVAVACSRVFYHSYHAQLAVFKPILQIFDEPDQNLKGSDSSSPDIIVKIKKPKNFPIAELSDKVLFINGIKYPGNLGDVLRTASALGVKSVVCCTDTVSPYQSETIDMAFGNVFGLDIHLLSDVVETAKTLQSLGYQIICTANSSGAVSIKEFNWPDKSVLVLGGERQGICKELLELSDGIIKIDMLGPVDALTSTSAGAIVIFQMMSSLNT